MDYCCQVILDDATLLVERTQQEMAEFRARWFFQATHLRSLRRDFANLGAAFRQRLAQGP